MEMNLKLCRIDKENRAEKGWSDRDELPQIMQTVQKRALVGNIEF